MTLHPCSAHPSRHSAGRAGLLFVIAVAMILPVAQARRFAAVEPDVPPTAQLAGQWTPVSAQLGGQDYPLANFHGQSLQLNGNHYAFDGDRGDYQVVYSGTPGRMDIHGDTGPHADKTLPALYLLSGNELTISYQLGPGVRPKDFTSPAGSQILVVRFRRGP